ncbi:(2Fe-2S)-binding protein [Aliiglaciecola sp. CAU 1673]|uniref:(2Fe-2S)-binding protein n=1 Tax=Aliiglaciecola sp. CAU 1673 TaxID=3032595 RepID=UPI0023DA1859|nr:(2Fe-2S)-binding protein [Aliiglaciecola sp. CAU 1673]MDF2180152.1 (2Fe-2S)-binding protein [Aliiglaciecola sp. CAU 1673]
MSIQLTINQQPVKVDDSDKDMPLLWFIREQQGLKGTKFGCGIGQCGACTVHYNGQALRSCSVTMEQLQGADIVTIEALAPGEEELHPVQEAWKEIDVPQCGYCQAGQIMAAAAMLKATPKPTEEQIDQVMTNICRCGTYVRIRKAIHLAVDKLAKAAG